MMTFLTRFSWLAVILLACVSDAPPTTDNATVDAKGESSDMTWDLMYSDRSANGFHFWRLEDTVHFRYDPVQPERSSSGIYSGGKPNAGTLTAEQFATLRGHLDTLAANTEAHVEQRTKGTGSVRITDKGTVQSFLIAARALDDFESFLDTFRGSAPHMLPTAP